MADNKVLIELQLVQKGDKVTIVQKQTEKLARSTDKLDNKRKKLTKTTDAYNRREKGAAQISSNSTKNFSKMAQSVDGGSGSGGLVRAYALLAANVFALSAAFGILSRSAQIDTLTQSMRQLEVTSGKSIVSVARNLQEASGFGLDFAESMRAVSLATSAGFGADKIEELGEVARNAAVSLGRNLPDALDRIFRGVIKVEPELLDEIGLFVRVNDAAAKYAAVLKISVGELTEFQKRQAFLNEAIEQGTSKFEAFAGIDNDAFALLATTFSDIAQNAISFLNKGITPIVKMLAENKVLFSAVFAALAGALLKLAVPAMAAFTASIATNAAKQSEASAAAAKDAQRRSQITRNTHVAYMAQKNKELLKEAELAGAASRGGMTKKGTIGVGGKEKTLAMEKLLRKENLDIDKRISTVNQRILDITTGRGKKARAVNTEVQKELTLLRAEKKVHDQILLNRKQTENINKTSVGGPGSNVERAKLIAYNASLRATSLATIANEAQTVGLKLALQAIGMELTQLTIKGAFATGMLGALQKAMFATKAGAVSLGIAAQTMWMRIMGPFSVFLMLLPVFMGFNKMLGVGSQASEKLTKANKASSDALELLGPRLAHVRKELEKIGMDDKGYNIGMESFKQTTLTTAQALIDQAKAFDEYKASASGWAQLWGETIPAIFGGGTANALSKGRKNLRKNLIDMGDDTTDAMKKAIAASDPSNFSSAAGGVSSKTNKEDAKKLAIAEQGLVDVAIKEAKAYVSIRSAIDGARDSARSFQNSLIVSTQVDKPLASMRQLESSLKNQNITTKEQTALVNELGKDKAVLALLSAEERKILENTKAPLSARLMIITKSRKEYERQQIVLIRSAMEIKKITGLSKSLSSLNKVSTVAIEKTFDNEKRIRDLKAEQLKFAKDNALKGQDLTESELLRFMAGESLLKIVGKEKSEALDLKAIQAAAVKLTEYDIELQKQRFEIATAATREVKMRAEATLNALKDEENLNKTLLQRAEIEEQISNFRIDGLVKDGGVEKLEKTLRAQKSADLTRKKVADQEAIIVKANKQIEADKMRSQAEQHEVTSAQHKLYITAAEALEKAGQDAADAITNGALDAAKIFKLKLAKTFSESLSGSDAGDKAFEDSMSGKLNTGVNTLLSKDGGGADIFNDVEKTKMAIQLMSQSLMDLGDTVENVLGKDGALLAGLARASAGFVALTTGYAQAMQTADTTSEKVAASASAIAGGIGQIMNLTSAVAAQSVNDIDKQIAAEKKRDGKSKESIAKMAAMEKKKENVQRKAFNLNKKLMIAQAIASTAAGIAATLPLMAVPGMQGLATGIMAMIAGVGAAQVALIAQLSFSGGASSTAKAPPQSISIGKREDKVDVSQGASSGELSYLRGERGVGSNANSFTPGGAAGMKRGYATGGEILVGERGPELAQVTDTGVNIVPNDKMGGGTTNANFTINAVDAAGVAEVLAAQRGNIIGMIREAAHEHGEEFIEAVETGSYGGGG